MKRLCGISIVIIVLYLFPVFATAHVLDGCWTIAEIKYNNVVINNLNSNDISDYSFEIALEIMEDSTCNLLFDNIIYPANIINKNGELLLCIGEKSIVLKESDVFLSAAFSKDFVVRLEKSNDNTNISNAIKINDALEQEEREVALQKAIEEAEAAARASIKPASVYDIKILFSKEDTEKMSMFMSYGRYYLDDDMMIGMAYDKAGFMPNLVKTSIFMDGSIPQMETFTVLDRHVNANFLTRDRDRLYFIRIDRENNIASLSYLNLKTDKIVKIGSEMHEMAFLQIHEGRLWYTGEEHRLYSCTLNGKDNKIELDKSIYYPYFLTEDWMIYQDELDGETLHLRCITDGTDFRITDTRSFNPIVDGTVLYFTSIPDDGGKAYLSSLDLRKPLKEGEMCFKIESSNNSMSTSFYIADSIIYGENNSSVKINNWKKLSNTAWLTITQRYFYIGDPYIIYGEMYSEHATVSQLYLINKETSEKSLFRHVY